MKSVILTIIICSYGLIIQAQENTGRDTLDQMRQAIINATQHPSIPGLPRNGEAPSLKTPGVVLPNGPFPKPLINQQAGKMPVNIPATKNLSTARTLESLCKDTSYRKLIGINNGLVFVQSVSDAMDGGIFVSATMYDTVLRMPHWSWRSFGMVIKLSPSGDIEWLKQFDDRTPGNFSDLHILRTFELPNHDIICTGIINNDGLNNAWRTVVYRLNSSGNIIWESSFSSKMTLFNRLAGAFTFYVESATEGLNGDVILCGVTTANVSYGAFETVVRLNNLGQLVWDANYGNHGIDGSYLLGANGISAFVKNGQIILIGLSHGNSLGTPPAINFLTLDYDKGNLLSKRFFRTSYTSKQVELEKSFLGVHDCKILSNGHILVYGKVFSGILHSTPVSDHFGIVEFDESFNLVNSYTIGSGVTTNYYNDIIHFDRSGKGALSILQILGGYETNQFFGTFENQEFLNQRKVHNPDVGLPGNSGFSFLPDNGYAFIQTYGAELGTKSYIEFRKMHNSDTSSKCLGKDTLFLRFASLNIIEDPTYFLLDNNIPNTIVSAPLDISQTDTTSTSAINPCKQTNFCDTVKIHGETVICGNSPSLTFTSFKNSDCGAIVQWNVTNEAVDSMQVITDSSVKIWFKNINWKGKLYAVLPAGACYTPSLDSIELNIIRLENKIDLGADTTLCDGKNITLRAGSTFADYLWQDGSADSELTVTAPGIYWVKTHDVCGNNFIDSITISPFHLPISIGADRIKCNNDTIHLVAPPDFINYSWSNAYNLSATTGQLVIANPLMDTAYYLQAEKTPGCFAYDTIRISVKYSPAIQLGADKSFCEGDSAILNAGNGFMKYQWSNGNSSQQITVRATGNYSVTGTTTDGCPSYDTVKINVWTKPVLNLNHSPDLCSGDSRILNAGNFESYLWHDGSTASSYTVTTIGTYWVQVTDANSCTESDTVKVTRLFASPANFLPKDTAICNYGSITLRPSQQFSKYLWNNNATVSSIDIKMPGSYWVQVTDANNCTGGDTIIVNPKACLIGFKIPNAFTPGNDKRNDTFKPLIGGIIKQYQFTIYNRYGQRVFSTNDIYMGWDGTLAGLPQDSNTFTWVCMYQTEGEPIKFEKGIVLLIR